MELRHLRYFVVVAEELSFTRAAARLGMSQPPLSQQIRDLETEIEVSLFERGAQGVTLTEAGAVFLREAHATLEQAERAKYFARLAAKGESGFLRIGITSTANFHPVPTRLIRDFSVRFPAIAISIEEGRSIRLVERLLTGELDVVFVRPSPAFPPDLKLHIFEPEPLVAALPEGHRLAKSQIALKELADETFITLGRSVCLSFYETVISACRAEGFDPVVGQQAARITSIIDLVAAGLGVALVPESISRINAAGVVYRNIKNRSCSVTLGLATRGDSRSAAVDNFCMLSA